MSASFARLPLRRTNRLPGAASLAIGQAVLIALGYVTHVLVGKIGGPPLYGVFGVVLSLLTIINLPLSFGVPVAASKEVAEDEENSGGVFLAAARLQLLFAFVLSLGTVLLARPVARLLGDETLTPIVRFAALIAPAQALYALLANYFNGLHAFTAQARLTVVYALSKLAGSVGLLAIFHSVPAALSGFLTGGLLATAFGLPQAIPTLRGRVRRKVPLRRLAVFAGSFVGTSVALQILMSLDLFLVKRLLHADTLVGYYTAASTIARIPYLLLQGLGFVFLPSVAKLFKEDPKRATAFIREVFRYLFLLLLPLAVLAAATSRSLVHLFFSAAYQPAAPALTILSFALVLLSAFYLLATIAAGAGSARWPFAIACLLIPVDLVLGVLLIPRLGLTGAAFSTLVVGASGTVILAAALRRTFQLSFPIGTLVRGTAAVTVTVLPTYFVSPPLVLIPFWYLVLLAVYALCLIALGEVRPDDQARVRSLLPWLKRAPST